MAASVSFVIGRTLLRGYVERMLDDNPRIRSMDNAIERGGFKLMLLVRLSPLFPFALSNYLYGASSVRFVPYFLGTVLGFLPGTFAYVYAGRVGERNGNCGEGYVLYSSSYRLRSRPHSSSFLMSALFPFSLFFVGLIVFHYRR